MADSRARRRALFSVLPRVFAGQPAPSALAGIIEAMAAALAGIDEGLTRTQRDHWLQLASGEASGSGTASALERLGALLGIDRLDGEESEAYRNRLSITARVLTRGLNTPRAAVSTPHARCSNWPSSRSAPSPARVSRSTRTRRSATGCRQEPLSVARRAGQASR